MQSTGSLYERPFLDERGAAFNPLLHHAVDTVLDRDLVCLGFAAQQ
ncbi:hypothetical protein [Bradyrhizobium sp. AZCC 2289]